MRNLLFVLAILGTVSMMTSEQAHAGGGGKKKQVRLEVTNVNPGAGATISVWALPADATLPATVGDARKLLPRREIAAMKTEVFPLTAGDYILVAVDTQLYASALDSDPVPPEIIAVLGPLKINGTTKRNVSSPGVFQTPVWP